MTRKQKLKNNFFLLFGTQALINFKLINVVSTLFYLHRGLTLTQIFYTAIVFSVGSILGEIPSSYLADRWGRKKTIMLATALFLVGVIVSIFAYNFYVFVVFFLLYAFSYSALSGTDEALLYDTQKELGLEKSSLKSLGKYISAQRIFKIFTPLIAVLIARNLTESSFLIILIIDAFASLIAFVLSCFITEPNHQMDLEKMEAGVMLDAIKFIKSDPYLIRAILNKLLIFISAFIIWRFYQQFFLDLGITLLGIGITTSMFQLGLFLSMQNISKFLPKKEILTRINIINYIVLATISTFVLFMFFYPNKYVLVVLFVFFIVVETSRVPLFSEYFNKLSSSYNRATVLSLTNFLKSILDIPLLFIGAMLIGMDVKFVYVFILIIITLTAFLLRLKKDTRFELNNLK